MRRPRPTYANITASLALFVALGGTSYAVTQLPRNSVGSTQVRDGSLQRKDLASSVLSGAARGPRGPEGPRGERGLLGSQGERGPSNVRIARRVPNVNLSGKAGQPTQVRRMENLPAGSWLLKFDANAYLGAPQSVYAVCAIKVNGDTKIATSAFVGQGSNAVQEVGIPIETAVQQPAPFTITVDCHQHADSDSPVVIVGAQIIATQVAEVIEAP